MSIPLDQIANMPAFSPYYPMPPARYRGATFHYVFFRARTDAVERVLPECFEPADDGMCIAMGLSVPWSSSYGAFLESVLSVKCTYQGQEGYFSPVAFLDSKGSIPAGREIWGTPKVYADLEVGMDERIMFTNTVIAGANLMGIRSTMQRPADISEIPDRGPAWRLKVIPRADGTGPDIMQLVDGADSTSDATVHVCRAGDGVVEFQPSPVYDLSDFTPIEYLGAYYVETDFTEGFGKIVRDFIKEPWTAAG